MHGGVPEARPHFRVEAAARANGCWPCAGADEAGRGPLAGPVVAAAVILDPDDIPDGIHDSKQLPPARREALFEQILARALAVSVASLSAESIDRSDIRKASLLAICRAVQGLSLQPAWVLVDGRDLPAGLPCPGQTIIGGDGSSLSVAAASIVAKTLRDRMMVRLGLSLPAYGFEHHKGYASAMHRAVIASLGGLPRLHRFTFAPLRQGELDLWGET
jgi:ribonuclease HII